MGVDTAIKRRSAASTTPTMIAGVTPDASASLVWRQDSGWGYSGIPVAAVSTPSVLPVSGVFVPGVSSPYTAVAVGGGAWSVRIRGASPAYRVSTRVAGSPVARVRVVPSVVEVTVT